SIRPSDAQAERAATMAASRALRLSSQNQMTLPRRRMPMISTPGMGLEVAGKVGAGILSGFTPGCLHWLYPSGGPVALRRGDSGFWSKKAPGVLPRPVVVSSQEYQCTPADSGLQTGYDDRAERHPGGDAAQASIRGFP